MKQTNYNSNKQKSSQQIFAKQHLLVAVLTTALLGCNGIPFIDNTSDYKGAGRSRPLEVPPDLTANPVSDAYALPGGTSYSSYSQGQNEQEVGVVKVLPNQEGVRLEKAGPQRWLVVSAAPDKVWPVVREFWLEQGFAVRVENPQTGVMETEWVDADKIKKDEKLGPLDKFDKWLDRLSGFGDKKKFRTRLDRGEENGTTEIYMTHRSVTGAPDDGKNRIQTQLGEIETGYKLESQKLPELTAFDAELDAELLRRLMVKLGIEERKSQAIMADAQITKRAEVVKEADGSAKILLTDAYDRAWRRVGLALDRVGFVIEDKDRTSGHYYVRYADVDIDDTPKKKKGLFETLKFWGEDEEEGAPKKTVEKKETDKKDEKSLIESLKFWGDSEEEAPNKKKVEKKEVEKKEDKKLIDSLKFWGVDDKVKTTSERKYTIKVEEDADLTVVTVVDKDGARLKTTTANRIIALMYDQLK